MCSPSEIDKLLKDDGLYKQYVLQKLIKIEEKLNDNYCDIRRHNGIIDRLETEINELKTEIKLLNQKIEMVSSDNRFFKKVIIVLLSIVVSLLGLNISGVI